MSLNKLFIFTFFTAFLLSSCKVYYSTSQVDSSFKSAVNSANNSLNGLTSDLNALEAKCHEIQCDTKPVALMKADTLFAEVKKDMDSINKVREALNAEYANFQAYTQGKSKIVSGTIEFKKMHHTKKAIKSKMADLKRRGNALVKKSNAFSKFYTKNVISQFRVANIAQNKAEFENSLSTLEASQKNFENQLRENEVKINEYVVQNSAKKPKDCSELKTALDNIHRSLKMLNEVKLNLQNAYQEFSTKTIGIVTLNNCSNNWSIVATAESIVQDNQNKLNTIQTNIQSSVVKIELLLRQ